VRHHALLAGVEQTSRPADDQWSRHRGCSSADADGGECKLFVANVRSGMDHHSASSNPLQSCASCPSAVVHLRRRQSVSRDQGLDRGARSRHRADGALDAAAADFAHRPDAGPQPARLANAARDAARLKCRGTDPLSGHHALHRERFPAEFANARYRTSRNRRNREGMNGRYGR
jgi:hypothetical protein